MNAVPFWSNTQGTEDRHFLGSSGALIEHRCLAPRRPSAPHERACQEFCVCEP
jgi:hypothetical protein